MTDDTSPDRLTGPQAEQLMTDTLHDPPLTEQSLERVRLAVLREWQSTTAKGAAGADRGGRRRARFIALAAAASLAMVLAWWGTRPSMGDSIGTVARVDDGKLAVQSGLFTERRAAGGEVLRVGDRLEAGGPVLISLTRGGTLRIAAGSRLRVTGTARLALRQGLIYLDLPPGGRTGDALRVETSAGAIEHVGTEFEVLSNDQGVRVRVREGSVRFIGTAARQSNIIVIDAGNELLVGPDHGVARRHVDTYGRDWLWTAALAPDFDIDGRSLIGFLQWASRELGRPLNFVDADARQIADRTILHGSIRHQAPIDAMSNVLATTSLTYEIRDESIWVRSSSTASL